MRYTRVLGAVLIGKISGSQVFRDPARRSQERAETERRLRSADCRILVITRAPSALVREAALLEALGMVGRASSPAPASAAESRSSSVLRGKL
jgi:hypothetical protein